MRIGILGGTFDPVHNGHIYLAEKVCRKLRLSRVIFIPSYIPPHKKSIKVTPAKHRYNMLKLAIADNKKFKISDMEIKRKGRSYSVETLRRLRKRYGAKAKLFFITGSDSLKDLDKWKNLDEILTLCKFVVVERPGFKASKLPKGFIHSPRLQSGLSIPPKEPKALAASAGYIFLKISAKDISATDIRSNIKEEKPLIGLIPEPVNRYIYRYKLYGALIVIFFMLFGANPAYSSDQGGSTSVIIKSQDIIEKEEALRDKINKDTKTHIKQIIVTGIALVDQKKIKEIIEPFKGHWLSDDDIKVIIDSITELYKKSGYSDNLEDISYKIHKNALDITVKEKID